MLPAGTDALLARAKLDFDVYHVVLHLFLVAVLELSLLENQVARLHVFKEDRPREYVVLITLVVGFEAESEIIGHVVECFFD